MADTLAVMLEEIATEMLVWQWKIGVRIEETGRGLDKTKVGESIVRDVGDSFSRRAVGRRRKRLRS